ncbi:MAG TPA: DNA polymerase III subunit beta [Desulfosporosinus sp.]|nr:DNA polymerase III subunit beta [Desulfosporosinus sp.]
MRFSCHKSILNEGMSVVQRAVSGKTSSMIMQGVLVSLQGNNLQFSATDLEMGIQHTVQIIDTKEDGSCVIPAKIFGDIIKKLPNTQVDIESKNGQMIIKYKGSAIELQALAADEFPAFPEESDLEISIPSDVLKKGVTKTIKAVAIEANRPVFTGILIVIKDGKIEFVATDTHRLAIVSMDIDFAGEFKAIVPAKALTEALKFNGNTILRISRGSQLILESDTTKIFIRTIDGQFPNYKQVIPQGHLSSIRVSNNEFKGAINRAILFTDSDSKVIKLNGSEKISIASASQKGKINEHIDVEHSGEPVGIAVNARFILDALDSVGETVDMELNGSTSPTMIRDDGYIHIVLPVRVS